MRKEEYSQEAQRTIEIIEEKYNIDWNDKETLKNVTSLNLWKSQISDISVLQELPKLTSLSLWKNQINDISVLQKLSNLTSLGLRNNQISDISALKNLSNLTYLNLISNQIKIFPQELLDLNLEIKFKIEGQYGIFIDHNPIQEPPRHIIKLGNQAIQKYFDDLEAQGRGKLNEAKFIIVGEPEAGKSSLMECLLDPTYKLEDSKESTMGIDVKPWKFGHPEQNEREMQANIWDFGGQQIQYMTHQFFLTPDSLYVLVTANDRKESTNFPYWFKIIHLLGEIDGRYSPVLVVKNKKSDQFHFDFDEAYYRRLYPKLQIEVREVDLGNRQGDFLALQEKIQEMITKLPLVNDDRPAKWSLIRQDLEKLEKNHINFEEYAKVCATHDVTDIESQKLLSSYLHSIGSLLHFIEDSSLRDFIILNPQWAVDAVYSVLSDTSVAQNQGEFDQKLLDKVWQEYSMSEQVNLLSLMKKDNFEICYPLNHQTNTYITPQLLPNTRPTYEFDTTQSLKFRFRYKFMPDGIISRLIVRLSEYIDDSLVWKKGVVLRDNDTLAQVIEEDNRDGLKIIDIHVSGEEQQRKYLLHTIRKEIDAIHRKWFKNIESEEMIPCGCSECKESEKPYYYEYSTLMKYQQKSKLTIECRESIEDVSVSLLIEGVTIPYNSHKNGDTYHINTYNNNSTQIGGNNSGTASSGDGNSMTKV